MSTKLSGTDTVSLSVEERGLVKTIYAIQEYLQNDFHDNVEIQTIMFFLEVAAQEEPIDLTHLCQKLHLSKAAVSRNYYRLADGRDGGGGLDLVRSIVDYQDRRRVLLALSPKGIEVIKRITKYLKGKQK
jgi:DNA-binding MarR family transcriptional regulator